ncbi:MAG: hypothetical protein RLZZ196_975 [Bacteroidota bacterium]|jgi:hypothetical protein
MKDEIKKKIEEEALRRFPDDRTIHNRPQVTLRTCEQRIDFIEAATYGYSLAQQSVNSELIRRMISFLKELEDTDECRMSLSFSLVLKGILNEIESASQNQQNENKDDEDWCNCDDEHVCGICHKRKGFVVNPPKEK